MLADLTYVPPLILTACVNPGATPYLALRDPSQRLAQYLASIEVWLNRSSFRQIVFCENSGFSHDYGPLVERAREAGKTLEILVFEGNKGSQAFGKGYGEGEILQHAVERSTVIANSACFYKATGRIFVRNADSIVSLDAGKPSTFIHFMRWRYADTRFFKVETSFFREELIDAYREVNDAERVSIEKVYRDRLRGKHVLPFGTFPDIVGTCASSGRPYDLSRQRLAFHNALLAAGIYTLR